MNFVEIGEYWINLAAITHVHVTRAQGSGVTAHVFFVSGHQAMTAASANYPGTLLPHSLELTGQDAELLIRNLRRQ